MSMTMTDTNIAKVEKAIEKAKEKELVAEVVFSIVATTKENPQLSLQQILAIALDEWDI